MDRTTRHKSVNLVLEQHNSPSKSDRHTEHSSQPQRTHYFHVHWDIVQDRPYVRPQINFMGITVPRDHSVNLLCCPSSQSLPRCTRDFHSRVVLVFSAALAHNRPESHWLARLWAGAFSDLVFQSFLPHPMITGHWLVSNSEFSQG